MDRIDQKIKNILQDLEEAHQKSEQYYAIEVTTGNVTEPFPIIDMSLAFDSERRLEIDLMLALSEKYPNQFRQEEIQSLNEEKELLTHRIRAYQNGQIPSKQRE